MPSILQNTLSLLEELGHTPQKKLGQNFLIDENVVQKFLKLADAKTGDTVVEVGPGLAVLTQNLLEIGVDLFAVEYDKRLSAHLANRFFGIRNFHLLTGDAVDFPTAGLNKDCTDDKIISSLPYSISSPWFDNVLKLQNLPTSIALVIQLETADRFCAKLNTKAYCPMSIFLQSAYDKTNFQPISEKSFFPIPDVESAMVFFQKKPDAFVFSKSQKNIIRQLFTHRRKQIGGMIKRMEVPALSDWMIAQNIDPMARPAQISIETWQTIPNL